MPRLLIMSLLLPLTACSVFGGKHLQHRRSSVVDYLYPSENRHVEHPTIPNLKLPARVGIAFVPEDKDARLTFTEKDKMELMKDVSQHFRNYEFVKSIEIIPSAYLWKNGSFANLDQIRTMYGIDIVALLSYDQTQFTDEGLASITYWTIVGAYVVPGEKNDTHTMVDALVYDIESRKMLFRAPGISHIKSKATPVNMSEQLRHDSVGGFKEASIDLARNLDIQLELFREKLKENPEDYKVVYSSGYTGLGSLDISFAIIVLLICGTCWLKRETNA
ncbi:MAG: rhombotarget lipoprotein [Deltaproteobacteria bacterium]|nr:rhombotarget lipoprotein [Deltaproteobacteria bacterium]